MGTSLTLFKVFDIDVRVHWSFVLILIYGAFAYTDSHTNSLVWCVLWRPCDLVTFCLCHIA